METKEELVQNIKEWIKIDSYVSKLRSEIKAKRNIQKTLTGSLVSVMKKNEIDCFDINGGSLIYKKNTVKKALNGKTILLALQNYYKNDGDTAEKLTQHILDSREEQLKETIKRKVEH